MSEIAALDRTKLLAFLHARSGVGKMVIQAVYAGAEARVERGDFDVTEVSGSDTEICGSQPQIRSISVELKAQRKTAPALAPTSELRGLTPTREGLIT